MKKAVLANKPIANRFPPLPAAITYEYKLYRSKRNRKLDAMLREACFVWNHTLALQKRHPCFFTIFGQI